MSGDNKEVIVLKGGRGGNGNMHYATSTMQAPKYAQPGQPAITLEVLLELKVIADVGLVGFPNVGKSTFLSKVSSCCGSISTGASSGIYAMKMRHSLSGAGVIFIFTESV